MSSRSGNTPLLLAADAGQEALVQALIQHGADVNASNHAGESALSLAVRHGHVQIATLLLEHQAKPFVPATVLEHASPEMQELVKRHRSVTRLLAEIF